MKLTIEELANKVNEQLSNLSSNDKRFSNNLSVRRIRDYMSKGVLDKPFKDGKNTYFTELHYQKLIALREIQSEGISDENVKKIISFETQSQDENSLQESAFSAINEILGQNHNFLSNSLNASAASLTGNSQSKSVGYLNSLIDNSNIAKSKETKAYISKPISKSWAEIPLLNNNKVFFRMESNTSFSEEEKQEVLQNIKQILGIQGEKND